MHTKRIGDISEAAVLAALVSRYEDVLIPFGENHRYDFVVLDDGAPIRIQCKTGRLRNGTVLFKACSSTLHHKNGNTRGYEGEADVFAVHCAELGQTDLVPVGDVPSTEGSLRVKPTKNNQQGKVRWAADYVV